MFRFTTNFLEPVALVVYSIALFIHYRNVKTIEIKLLLFYYLIVTVVQTFASFGVGRFGSNIWLYDLEAIFASFFLSIYFYRLFPSSSKKKTVVILTSIYITYVMLREFTLTGIRLFDSIGYSVLSASVAVYVFMYYSQVLKNVTAKNILQEFNFWLASGYLFYYVGCFFIFVSYYYFTVKYLANKTQEIRNLLTALWGLHNVLLFISALSLLIGTLWIKSRMKLV